MTAVYSPAKWFGLDCMPLNTEIEISAWDNGHIEAIRFIGTDKTMNKHIANTLMEHIESKSVDIWKFRRLLISVNWCLITTHHANESTYWIYRR